MFEDFLSIPEWPFCFSNGMLQLGLGLLQQTVFPAKKGNFYKETVFPPKINLSSPFLLATGKSNSAIFGQHQLSNLNYSISFQWISSKKLPKKAKYAFFGRIVLKDVGAIFSSR